MFERYSEKARRVVFFARYEASQYGSPYIEAEHMLLGLLREDKVLFARLLPNGPGIDALRDALQPNMQQRAAFSTSVDLPLSHFVKRSLAFAAEESERCGVKHIDPAHLLLGLLREESAVSEVFGQFGINLESLREKAVQQAAPSSSPGPAEIVAALRLEFSLLAKRLRPEIEPATVFGLRGSRKDIAS